MTAQAHLHALPLLMLNLGGELVYVIRQRLNAHNIAPEKARLSRFEPQLCSVAPTAPMMPCTSL